MLPQQRIPPRTQPTPWSRIPTHLLVGEVCGASQLRWSSSDSRSAGNETSGSSLERRQDQQQQDELSDSSFGFQSLSGLFQQPEPQPRYSRPRGRGEEAEKTKAQPVKSGGDDANGEKKETGIRVGPSFFRSSPVEGSETRAPVEEERGKPRVDQRRRGGARPAVQTRSEETTASTEAKPLIQKVTGRSRSRVTVEESGTSHAEHAPTKSAAHRARKLQLMPKEEPMFDSRNSRGPQAGGDRPSIRTDHRRRRGAEPEQLRDPEKPWGLSPEGESNAAAQTTASAVQAADGTDDMNAALTFPTPPPKSTNPSPSPPNTLTHLDATGSAHMVDISAKPVAKRIAVATTTVIFSNPTPLQQIRSATNKKGDVLSTARIAGIMAAKNTSTLIPLCHPIALTRVSVDLDPGSTTRPLRSGTRRGSREKSDAIVITTRVECVGSTGVEMEALSAATAAGLTVYDMCKAVDKSMRLDGARMLYKAGGRSGVGYDGVWVARAGKAWCEAQGLELPRDGGHWNGRWVTG